MSLSFQSTYLFFKRLLNGTAVALFALACLFLIYVMLRQLIPDNVNFSYLIKLHLIYKYIVYIFFVLFLLSATIVAIGSLWGKTEEEQEFEDKLNYILSKHTQANPYSLPTPSADYQPLSNLSENKREQLIAYLRSLPDSASKQGSINLALMAQHLVALSRMGFLDISDKPRLRRWVASITGKQVPSSSQFNEAITNVSMSKLLKAESDLRNLLA